MAFFLNGKCPFDRQTLKCAQTFSGRSRDTVARETWDQLSPPVGLAKNNQF